MLGILGATSFSRAALLLVVLFCAVPVGRGSISRNSWDAHNGAGGPHFKSHAPRMGRTKPRVVVREGSTARLPCIVHHLGDRSVTWMRMRDLHILTAGQLTYSADDRFQVAHPAGSTHWGLVVQDARSSDAGLYHCTVNTDPQLYSVVTLIVTEKQSESDVFAKGKVFVANNTASTTDGKLSVSIDGPRELHIEEGSSLTLRCTVRSTAGLPSVVYWYHASTLLDYNSPRGGVQLQSDAAKGEAEATLRVWAVGPGDSGMYSCVPQGSHPASVLVHVQKGDREAAIQQGGLEGPSPAPSSSPSFLIFQPHFWDAAEWLLNPSTPSSRRTSYPTLAIPLVPLLQAHVFVYCRLLFSR